MKDKYADLPLGKETEYPSAYDASLLCPIARELGYKALGLDAKQLPFVGVDRWTAYEVSWLNSKGKPVVAIADFSFDCQSKAIIESKSFKLYLNSFNQTRFESREQVAACMVNDLSAASSSEVSVTLYAPNEWHSLQVSEAPGQCLDDLDIAVDQYHATPDLLALDSAYPDEGLYHSHLLRSLCPVTGQPDWGSIVVSYQGATINPERLLSYIISYREHQDFHEQCVERVYCDIMQHCKPENLMVYARYVRRGGMDINPYRSSSKHYGLTQAVGLRLARQ